MGRKETSIALHSLQHHAVMMPYFSGLQTLVASRQSAPHQEVCSSRAGSSSTAGRAGLQSEGTLASCKQKPYFQIVVD